MKFIALCLFAFACYAVVESAPIKEELLQNIEIAAEAKVENDETQAAKYNAEADTEDAQLVSNKKFATDLTNKISSQEESLALMTSDEEKTIMDANAIRDDTKSADTSDIETKDMDAEKASEEIQQTAEQVDTVLLASIEKMRSVGIEGQKKAAKLAGNKAAEEVKLGDAQFPTVEEGTYKERLTTVEDDAREMVDQAAEDKQTAKKRLQKDDAKFDTMVSMAATGMKQLTKSEQRLHSDLKGHDDKELEEDIESKAEEIDSNSKLGENDDPLKAAVLAAEAAADDDSKDDSEDDSEDDSQLDSSSNYAPEEHEADGSEADFSTAREGLDQFGKGDGSDEDGGKGDGSSDRTESDDLKAIKSDATKLAAYQKNSLNEIAAITEPLH